MIKFSQIADKMGVKHHREFIFNGGSICTDTRKLKPGDVYLALTGQSFDGHDFVDHAVAEGAAAIIVNKPFSHLNVPQLVVSNTLNALEEIAKLQRSFFSGQLVAVTGSCGKTSVKEMLACILSTQGKTFSTPGNFNNQIGVPLSLLQLQADHKFAVLELGTSAPGEIEHLVALVAPDIALVTNIKEAHLEGLGTVDDIAKEKAAIYCGLKTKGTAVVNGDEAFAEVFFDHSCHCRHLVVGLDDRGQERQLKTMDVSARDITCHASGPMNFDLVCEEQVVNINLSVLGKHNINNALLAAGASWAAGVELSKIKEGLENYTGVTSRMQPIKGINGSLIIDDTYNANPGSVKAAIDYLSSLSCRTILVLGDMGELGEETLQAHADIGEYALTRGISNIFAVGTYMREAVKHFGDCAKHFDSKEHLVQSLVQELSESAVVLVKGSRSAHMEDVVESTVIDSKHDLSAKGATSQC